MKIEFMFPERNVFLLDHQHGRCDVKCKLFVKFLARSQFVVDVVLLLLWGRKNK